MNPDEQKQSVIFLGKHFRRNFSHLNEAEYAFRRKYIYSNNYFKINGNEDTSDQKHNQFILSKYGSKLTAISVESVDLVDGDVESDWLLDSIVENCISLKKLALHFLTADFGKLFSKLPQLTHLSINYLDTYDKDWSRVNLPNLRYVSIKADVRLESHQFAAFIANNPKIEIMELKLHFSPLQGIDGKLNALKHLKICGPDFLANSQIADQVVRLDSLVTLDIDCIDIVRVLQIFRKGCDTIKYLSICSKQIFQRIPLDMEAFLTALGSFGQVRTLAIVNIKLNEQMIKRIGITLQNLSSLSIEMQTGPNIVTEVLSVVPTFRYSHELTIRLDCRMTNSMNYDFHKRFVDAVTKHRSDFKLKLIFRNNDQLIFTNESIMQKKGTSKPIRIHWTGYEAEYSASNVHMFDLRTKHFKTLYDSMDLLSLLQLKLTCHQMQSNVQLYVDDAYQRRTFVCSSNDNMNELHRLLQHFGQYFRYLRIHISSICESTEIFSWINQYCKNVTHMYLLNQSFTTRLIHPVQFELPHLEELVYQADNNIDLEISAFGGCLSLQHLEVRSPGKLDDKVPVLTRNGAFANLITIKLYLKFATAIDLLEQLSLHVSFHLEELWITTPVYCVEDIPKKRFVDVITYLHRINTLHLIIPNKYFAAEELFQRCRRLIELSILSDAPYKSMEHTLKSIQENCTELKSLQIFYYDYCVKPENVCQMALNMLPNAEIKSIEIDTYGKVIVAEHCY